VRGALALTALAGAALGALLAGPGMPLGGAAPDASAAGAPHLDEARALASPFDDPALADGLPEILREPSFERGAVERHCLTCHGWPLVAGQRLTRPQWEATVAKMREKFHAPLTPLGAEEAAIVDLLSRALGPEAPPGREARLEAVTASAAIPSFEAITAALPGADAARGAQLFAATCAACHGKDAQGGPVGPRLALRPVLADEEGFQATLRLGRRAMPARPDLSPGDGRALLAHLRSLRGNE